jgi:ribosomal protein L11 methylase PrmA
MADRDGLVADLWEQGTLGILEEGPGLRAFFENPADIDAIARMRRSIIAEVRCESRVQGEQFAQDNWDPVLIGQRFFVAPSWVHDPTPPGRFRLVIDSETAFGTGRHESTQLAIEALELLLRSGDKVLDIGCGSGILSLAATMLGARRVFSCDIHKDAVNAARCHGQPAVFLGSADSICTSAADLVLVNISAGVIENLHWDLNRVTKPDGWLILAGFVRERPPAGFRTEKVLERGDGLCWLCLSEHIEIDEQQRRAQPLVHSDRWC